MTKIFGYLDSTQHIQPSRQEFPYHQISKVTDQNVYMFSNEASLIYSNSKYAIIFYGTTYPCESTENILPYIISLYAKYGTDAFSKLEGIYAFVLLDKKEKNLYLVRDRVGIKNLYYYQNQNRVIFSNTLHSLYHNTQLSKYINLNALALYFSQGYILEPHTIYENCYKVPAGSYIQVNMRTNQSRIDRYWTLGSCYECSKMTASEQNIIRHTDTLLQKSIDKRIIPNQKIGAFLSGGYDSAVISALLQQKHHVTTFTIGFKQEEINEAHNAKKIAQYLGTNHIEYYVQDHDASNIIPKLFDVYEEPFLDYASMPTMLLAQLAKKEGIDLLFGGDGGDEVFATADDIVSLQKLLSLPNVIKFPISKALDYSNRVLLTMSNPLDPLPTKINKLNKIFKTNKIQKIIQAKMSIFSQDAIEKMLHQSPQTLLTAYETMQFGSYAQHVDHIIGTYFQTMLRDSELVKVNQVLTYANIKMRNPFLDQDLIAYMAQVPQEIKIKDGNKKHILKHIAYQYMPKQLLDRPKMGFDIPFSEWLRGELNEMLLDHVNVKSIQKSSILKHQEVIYIRDKFLQGDERYKYKLWSIFLYQLWFDKNFN